MRCLGALILVVLAVVLAMVVAALAVGSANAWFLSANFSDGWNAAWGRPLVLFGWSLLFTSNFAAWGKLGRSA